MRLWLIVAQWLEHCVSSAKVVGSIPREHTYWQYKCIAWMHCKSLWIKASAKCINVNENCQEKLIQEFGWTSQGMDWDWGQVIKSTTHRRVKEFGYSCRQRRLTWAKEKKNWTVAQWSKSSFQMRSSFVFHLETKVLESGWRVEKLIAQVAWSPVLSFHSLWWFEMQCHLLVLVHCVFWKPTSLHPFTFWIHFCTKI